MTGTALFAAAFIMMVNALVGDSGYLATFGARSERDGLTNELAILRQQNQQLQEQIDRLKHDPAAVEEVARRKLNMIKPGETMIVLKDAPAPKK
jgi:cell division protein FtsB